MTTKKLLAPVDSNNVDKDINGFLYPDTTRGTRYSFLETDSGKEWKYGRVVFVGVEVTSDDIFSRIKNSKKKIQSGGELRSTLSAYIEQVKSFKIGSIVGIEPTNQGCKFELIKANLPPRKRQTKLP